jgi:Fe2+ or Zn2+ uptake regulation protein/O6-methylguanine-DNA--protein-cysteine methyltransferase
MFFVSTDPGETLREHGLRSTPQRRAILTAFEGGPAEHLSADEVHARASQLQPDLGRGTVYATLAELTELGLLGAIGAPEPVRYEINATPHDHFRCRVCLRHFDVDPAPRDAPPATPAGFTVERVETRLEGVCAECAQYAAGLSSGARAIAKDPPLAGLLDRPGVAYASTDGPLGPLQLAASPDGLVRIAFEHHADFAELQARSGRRRGGQTAREHLRTAIEELARFFAGELTRFASPVDWAAFPPRLAEALRAAAGIPFAGRRSYAELGLGQPARELGRSYGTNPVPLLVACHRVTRGVELPDAYVGGLERRRWLEAHELRVGR